MQDPRFLERYGYKVYSQNDEDGILQEIFVRIGTQAKRFVEFGVQDGLECNSHYLLYKGWTGLWLEGNVANHQQIQTKFASAISEGLLKTDCVFITRENINSILARNGFCGEIDLLSIDIDGNDYHIWEEISQVSPRVVCIEYNGRLSPDCEWVMPYYSEYVWQGDDYFGASLKSMEKLGAQKGYQLVGTNITGVNAFFVRADLAGEVFPLPATAENLYNAPQYQTRHITGHPSRFCLASGHNIYKKPEWSGFQVNIMAEDVVMPVGERERTINVTLKNMGMEVLSSQRVYPINLCYHLLDTDGNMILFDGERTLIQNEIRPGMTQEMQLRLVIPSELVYYEKCICRITLVVDGCFWLDQEGENKTDILIHFK